MIYPHMFHNCSKNKIYVIIALSDLSSIDMRWACDPDLVDNSPALGGYVLHPTVDLEIEKHVFEKSAEGEKAALEFIRDWWATRVDVTDMTLLHEAREKDRAAAPKNLEGKSS